MLGTIMAGALKSVTGVVETSIKSKAEQAVVMAELQKVFGELDKQIVEGQVQQNIADAASNDKFRTRWRPAVAWICVAAMFYHYIVYPLLLWVIAIVDGVTGASIVPPPDFEIGPLMTLVTGMLGLGLFRGIEKINGKP